MSPSTCSVPRPMILSPSPMILRSFPMTDFSPLDGGVRSRCLPSSGLGAEVCDGALAPTEELRVNTIASPDENNYPGQFNSSTSPLGCNLLALLHRILRTRRACPSG